MQPPAILRRVTLLEEQMEQLVGLPVRMAAVEERLGAVELQIVQSRGEMRGECSAVRAAMKAQGDEQRVEMKDLGDVLRTHMLTLHENVIATIATLGEGLPAGGRRPRRKK